VLERAKETSTANKKKLLGAAQEVECPSGVSLFSILSDN
jgi:hypothetical protein